MQKVPHGQVLANRFNVLRRLGGGGMGEVYEAYDRTLDDKVAIKKLPSLSPKALLLFKTEFRSLQDFGHPNVVKLGELFEGEGEWFFSMELVQGCDLITYIRGSATAWPTASGTDATQRAARDELAGPPAMLPHTADEELAEPRYDEHRLRSSIAQLAGALAALHSAGKIHRDVKRNNVLVRPDGRIVLLDFGLIVDGAKKSRASTLNIVGTPEYMAPEQAEMSAITPAADCYSLGVILFEALAGRLPFKGEIAHLIYAKTVLHAPDVREHCPQCPDDLAELCMALLARDPAARPSANSVLARIATEPVAIAVAPSSPPPRSPSLVGRDAEIAALSEALADVSRGELTSVVIQGESGIGKSSLVRRFLDDHRRADGTVVLAGRCYEKESVPFKAFDEIVDSLSHYLQRQPKLEIAEIVPRYAAYLQVLFPVIGLVPGFDKPYGSDVTDPNELRHRAVSALREVFSMLGERRTIIVHIDDFQWADQDSMFLLSRLLAPPDPPRMLLLIASRRAPDLAALGLGGAVRTVELGPLNRDSAALLAHQALDASMASVAADRFNTLIEEARGHPYFITELVRHIQRSADDPGARLDLDEAIWARATREDADALRVLKYVCVAGVPIEAQRLQDAVEQPPARFHAHCANLTRECLIRTTDGMLVPYHDRVREAVVKRLAHDELQALHARLAKVFEGHPDLALLVRHLEASGQDDQAARMALAAARKAREGLAFERAVELYRHRLRLGTTTPAERCDLLIELGATLVAMTKGLEAAEVYLEAAEHGDPAKWLACNIEATNQLLIGGHMKRGLMKLRDLFTRQGIRFPPTPTYALLGIARDRVLLSMRNLRRMPRKARASTPNDHARLALYKAAMQGQVLVDPIRAAFCVGRGLLLSRAIGDLTSYRYFLLLEGDLRKAETSRQSAGAGVVAAFDELFEHDPGELSPIVPVHKGARTYMNMRGGDLEALDALISGDEKLSATRIAPWELVGGRIFLLLLLRRLGRYSELRQRFTAYVLDAQRRNDVYTEATMQGFCNLLYLIDDDPRRARDELGNTIWIELERGFHVQHWYDFNALMELHLYEGVDPDFDHVHRRLAAFRWSQLGRLAVFRVETEWLVGRLALAFPETARFGHGRIRTAIRRLERTSAAYPRLLAAQLRAGLAHAMGDDAEAREQLKNAIHLAKGLDMRVPPAAAAWQLASLLPGDEGEAMRERARSALAQEGVRDVARFAHLMLPGFARTPKALPANGNMATE